MRAHPLDVLYSVLSLVVNLITGAVERGREQW